MGTGIDWDSFEHTRDAVVVVVGDFKDPNTDFVLTLNPFKNKGGESNGNDS